MLDQGYLVGAAVYTTYAYADEIIDNFIHQSHPAFAKIRKPLDAGQVRQYLRGEVLHAGFKRLT